MFNCIFNLVFCRFFCPAEDNASCICSFGRKQIVCFFWQFRLQFCVNDRNHIANLIPFIQWFIVKNVKKFVYIINPGRFNNYSVISAHSHCDQFCPETSSVRFFVAPTGNHFKLTVISHQVLQKKHIYIYRTKIILKDANVHSFIQKIFCIFFNKRCLAGT